MIVRPLELAARLRPEPRWLDWLHFANAGLLVVFFSLFGSRFVLAPGLRIELQSMVGARASATVTTHYISVAAPGRIFNNEGPVTATGLADWLKKEGARTKDPSLLVRAGDGVQVSVQAAIASAATAAGFRVVWAFAEPTSGDARPATK